MKRFFGCLTLMILVLAMPVLSAAADVNSREPMLRDDAELLTESQLEELREKMLPLCEFGTPMFWTTSEKGSSAVLAERFYHSRIGAQSGILFMINMQAREIYIFRDGVISRLVRIGDCLGITDNVYQMASKGYYGECAEEAFAQVYALLIGARIGAGIASPMRIITCILLSLTFALIITVLLIRFRNGRTTLEWKKKRIIPVIPMSASVGTKGFSFTKKVIKYELISSVYDRSAGSSGGGHGDGGHGGGRDRF